jgi:hypothetical protein
MGQGFGNPSTIDGYLKLPLTRRYLRVWRNNSMLNRLKLNRCFVGNLIQLVRVNYRSKC